jgi:predicted transcriptional regulator
MISVKKEKKYSISVILESKNQNKTMKFSDYEGLYRFLTPERLKILQTLLENEIQSIENLSEILERNLEDVKRDVFLLENFGFLKIEKTSNGQIFKPTTEKNFNFFYLRELKVCSSKERISTSNLKLSFLSSSGFQVFLITHYPTPLPL